MSWLILLLGAWGLALFVTGLPPLRRPTLNDRVAPHLPGASLPRRETPADVFQSIAAKLPLRDDNLDVRLSEAGLGSTPLAFRTEQLAWGALALAGVAGLTILLASVGIGVELASTPVLALLSFSSGYLGRDWWLGRQIRARRDSLKEELPTAIDMLCLALIAGESANAALARVGATLGGTVGHEFGRILGDVRAGRPFVEALQTAKDRTTDASLARLLDSLTTGIEKGSPLADVLRAQADDARQARGREMLEAAGRKEVLMLVPVVFLIMPVIVIYALFPGLVSLDLFVR